MGYYFDYEATVGGHRVDKQNRCRPSALLTHLQEAAMYAAEGMRVTREDLLARHNVFWMLARMWVRLDRPLGWEEKLQIRTWHRGGKGVTLYRDFDLYASGEPVGEAVSSWVLADWDTKRLLRVSAVPEFAATTGGALCKERLLRKLQMPAPMEVVEHRLIRDSDTDINGHVNNARYADFVSDALDLGALGPSEFVAEMQIGYLAECRPGETLRISAARTDGEAYVSGEDPEGTARFDSWIRLGRIQENE